MYAMVLTLLVTLYISDTASGDSNTDEFGWVVACEVLDDESDAEGLSEELNSLFGQYTGYLWIPDWASLSGSRGWLVYLGPFETSDFASHVACFILWKYPDTYSIQVSGKNVRNTVPPTPVDFSDFTGLAPPLSSFQLRGEMPSDWEIDWVSQEVQWGEESKQATKTLLSIPGWSVEDWIDDYIGSVEYRAIRESLEDPEGDFEKVSCLTRKSWTGRRIAQALIKISYLYDSSF